MKRRHVIVTSAIVIILCTWLIWAVLVLGRHQVTGRASSVASVGLVILSGEVQPLNLTDGWNFVSFYVLLGSYDIETTLAPIEGYYDYIQEWDSSAQDFRIWSRFGLKQFTEFNQNKSYFIYMNNEQLTTLNGRFFQNWTINLSSGWETPNYVYEYPTNITGAGGDQFENVTFSYMQKWNASGQEFMIYSPKAVTNPFNQVNASEGYLILTEGGQLIYIRN